MVPEVVPLWAGFPIPNLYPQRAVQDQTTPTTKLVFETASRAMLKIPARLSRPVIFALEVPDFVQNHAGQDNYNNNNEKE